MFYHITFFSGFHRFFHMFL